MADPAPNERVRSRLARIWTGQGVGSVLARGASGSAGAQLAGALLALLAQLALARLLDVTQYGYFAYAFTWTLILCQVARLGFHNSLVRFTAAYRSQREWPALRGLKERSSAFVGASALATGLSMAAVALLLRQHMPAAQLDTFLIAAIAVIPMTHMGVAQGLLQGYRCAVRAFLPFRTFLHGGLLLLALVAGAIGMLETAPAAMALTAVSATGAWLIAMYWAQSTIGPDIDSTASTYRTRYWLRASMPLMVMAGMRVIMRQTDVAMLGALAGTDAAGLYFPVARMSDLVTIGLVSANAIVAPMISELYTSGDKQRLQRLLKLAALSTTAVAAVIAVGFVLLGGWLLGLFGEAFRAGYPALIILVVGQLINALCGPVGFLMTMTGHQDQAVAILIAGAALNIVANAALIPMYGLVGAAAATAITMAFWNLWMIKWVLDRLGVNPSVFGRWQSSQE